MSLTSLKKESPPDTSKFSSHDRAQIKLGSLKAEIDLLTKKKDGLATEVETVVKTRADTRKQIGKEIKKLEKRKELLLKKVDLLTESFDFLEDSQEKVSEAFDKFGQERIDTLTGISKALQLEIHAESSKLSKKFSDLRELERFSEAFADFYTKYAKIVEADTLTNARRGTKLDEKVSRVLKEEERLKGISLWARELLQKARSKWSEVDGKYEKIKETTSWFENEADKEKGRLDIWAKTLEFREKKVASAKRVLKKAGEKQEKKGLWLLDQEEILRRTMSEVRKRENDIMKHG